MFPPAGGFYEALDGVDIRALPQHDEDAALALIRAYSAPADSKALIGLATALKVGCKARAEGEQMTAAQLKFYADALSRYPADIARKAVMDWIETQTFFPALAEIHTACKRLMTGRDRLARALKNAPSQETERAFVRVTPEQAAAIRAEYGRPRETLSTKDNVTN